MRGGAMFIKRVLFFSAGVATGLLIFEFLDRTAATLVGG